MTPAFRKQVVTTALQDHKTQELLDLLAILLVVLKKFGKQLSQSPIKEFVQKLYPDAYHLYETLGGVHLSIKDCLTLQQHLYESLGEKVLLASASDADILKDLGVEQMIVQEWAHASNPWLRMSSAKKLYKRSLSSDLQKLL